MSELENDIKKSQLADILHKAVITGQEELIEKAFSNLIEKGKKANIGEVREWAGKKYRKNPMGKWEYVSDTVKWQEEFVDEDTGEVVNVPRKGKLLSDAKIKEIEARINSNIDKYNAIVQELKPLYEERSNIWSEKLSLKRELDEIDDLIDQRNDLDREQEQAIPEAREKSPEEEDRVAQEYGERMNKLDEEIDAERKKNKEREEQIDKLQDDYWKIDDKIDPLQDKAKEVEKQIDMDEYILKANEELKSKRS